MEKYSFLMRIVNEYNTLTIHDVKGWNGHGKVLILNEDSK